jgi:hypothetical protein
VRAPFEVRVEVWAATERAAGRVEADLGAELVRDFASTRGVALRLTFSREERRTGWAMMERAAAGREIVFGVLAVAAAGQRSVQASTMEAAVAALRGMLFFWRCGGTRATFTLRVT